MLVMKVLKMDKMMWLKMITTRMLRMKSKTQPRREEKDPPDPAAEVSLLLLIQYLPYMAPSYQHRQAVLPSCFEGTAPPDCWFEGIAPAWLSPVAH